MIEGKRKKEKHNLHLSFLKTKRFSIFFSILMFLFLTNNDKIIIKIIIKKTKTIKVKYYANR
jgi:hypothetical protein